MLAVLQVTGGAFAAGPFVQARTFTDQVFGIFFAGSTSLEFRITDYDEPSGVRGRNVEMYWYDGTTEGPTGAVQCYGLLSPAGALSINAGSGAATLSNAVIVNDPERCSAFASSTPIVISAIFAPNLTFYFRDEGNRRSVTPFGSAQSRYQSDCFSNSRFQASTSIPGFASISGEGSLCTTRVHQRDTATQ